MPKLVTALCLTSATRDPGKPRSLPQLGPKVTGLLDQSLVLAKESLLGYRIYCPKLALNLKPYLGNFNEVPEEGPGVGFVGCLGLVTVIRRVQGFARTLRQSL